MDDLVRGETVKQLQRAPPPLKGKVSAPYQNSEWQADLIDWTTAPSSIDEEPEPKSKRRNQKGPEQKTLPSGKEAEKYILVVQDVFSRKIWTRALVTKQPPEVQQAFKQIVDQVRDEGGELPNKLTTDAGGEFADVKTYMNEMNRIYRIRTSQRSLATLDSAIGALKKALARDLRKAQTDNWAARLAKVTNGQNNTPKPDYLNGGEPNEVNTSLDMTQMLEKKNANFTEINKKQIADRAEKLEQAGKYRTLLNRGKFHRGWQPNWSETTRTVASIDFNKVKDVVGQESLTRFALPVASATAVGPPRQIEKGGSVETNRRQRNIIEPFVSTFYFGNGGQNQGKRITLAQASTMLDKIPGFKASLILARVNMKSRIASALRLFPNLFEIQGNYVQILSSV